MESRDKRLFKRYHRISDIDLKHEKKLFRAKLIDYCVDGLGAVIRDKPLLKKGDTIDVTAYEPEIERGGEIVWSKNTASGQRIGIRISGQLKGRIRDFRFSDTLIGLQRSQKTGVLTVEDDGIIKKVYIKNGDMIFAASNRSEDRLGDILLREGKIDIDQYNASVSEMKKMNQRQGAALVRLGYLKPHALAREVKHQVEEIIISLFSLIDGKFEFDETRLPTEEVITLKLSAANLIYHGIKRIGDGGRLKNELPSMDCVFSFSPDPLNLFQDIRLDQYGKKIIGCIDGKTSVKDIISITQMEEFEALKTIYGLLSVEMIDITGKGEPPPDIPEAVIEEILEEKKEEKPAPEIDPQIKEMIEGMHKRYEGLGYYGVLGVKDYATLKEIKTAYYKTAKKFHPDMHFHLHDDSLKGKLSEIFSFIYEAYATLSNPQKRKEYDRLLTLKPARLHSNQDKAKVVFEEGKAQYKKNNYSEAELLFGQAIYYDGTISDYHYYYGLSLMKKDKLKEAEAALTKALRISPLNPEYLADLGFIMQKMGFARRAKGCFERALKEAPGNIRAAEALEKIKVE